MREIGVSVIDTDDSSTSGHCETMIGATFQGRRNDFVAVTKDFPHPAQYALRSTALLTLRSSATLQRLSEAGPYSHFHTFPHSTAFISLIRHGSYTAPQIAELLEAGGDNGEIRLFHRILDFELLIFD